MRNGRRILWTAYIACMAAAVLVLVVTTYQSPRHHDSYTSLHPASPMTALMGFSADALVNAGDEKALDALPGVGEVIAYRIIDTRAALGGFRLPEDLLLVKGIGDKTLDKIMEALKDPLVQLSELDE